MSKNLIQLGIVGKAHGLDGAFFISHREEPLPRGLRSILVGKTLESARPLEVLSCQMQSGRPLVRCRSVVDRTAAEQLVGQTIWGERAAIRIDEEQEYLWADLVGKQVLDVEGNLIGVVARIANFGASDVIQIEDGQGQILDVPFVRFYFDMNFTSRDSQLRMLVPASTFEGTWSPS